MRDQVSGLARPTTLWFLTAGLTRRVHRRSRPLNREIQRNPERNPQAADLSQMRADSACDEHNTITYLPEIQRLSRGSTMVRSAVAAGSGGHDR